MAHEEALIKQLERKIVDGEKLMDTVSKINNVNGVQKLKKKIKQEVCFLLKVQWNMWYLQYSKINLVTFKDMPWKTTPLVIYVSFNLGAHELERLLSLRSVVNKPRA